MNPVAVMVHVNDISAGLSWYLSAFPEAKVVTLPDSTIQALEIGNFLIEVVTTDEKVSSGIAGTVLYWQVENLQFAIERFKLLGSVVYRGPMLIEHGLGMCQVTDTFGNLIGLRGPYRSRD